MAFCPGCPRRGEGLHAGSRGPRNARVAVIGLAPGVDELAVQKPFMGVSGRILAAAMLNARVDPREVRYLNILNCPPAGGIKEKLRVYEKEFENGKNPTWEQLCSCSDRLRDELHQLSGLEVVVLLGDEAIRRCTGILKDAVKFQNHALTLGDCAALATKKGTLPMPIPSWVKWVVPLYHPAYVKYRGMKGEMASLKAGFQKVREMLDKSYEPVDFKKLGPEVGLKEIARSPLPVAFDIENPYGCVERISFAIIDEKTGETKSWSGIWTPATKEATRAILGESKRVKIAHNAAHDIRYLAEEGVEVADPVDDTMWMHQLLQPEMEKSLDAVSGVVLKVPRWKHLAKTDPHLYNRLDSHVTAMVWLRLRRELRKQGIMGLFRNNIMPALRTLIRCTMRGLKVDPVRLGEWKEELERTEEELLAKLQSIGPTRTTGKKKIRVHKFNPGSHVQVKQLLYEQWGLPMQMNRGKVTSDEGALEKLRMHLLKQGLKGKGDQKALEFIETLLKWRDAKKQLGTYASIQGDAVHPAYFPVGKDDQRYGTATGRLSSQNPNIQNQPPQARRIFIPHGGEEYGILEADYSQIELRVAAWQAGEDRLIEMFLRGDDVHAQTQRLIGCDRTRAKNVAYGTLYGAGPRRLYDTLVAEGFKTSVREMRELQEAFFKAYPKLQAWRELVVAEARRDGYAKNPWGRRRYFYKPERSAPEIVNYHPQSTVADIVLDRLPAVEAVFEEWGGKLLTTVHDSFVGECREDVVGGITAALRAVLEKEFPEVGKGFWVPVEFKFGRPSWGDCKVLEGVTA